MNAGAILDHCRAMGLHVEADGGDLVVKPHRLLTPELLEELRQHKPALLAALREQATPGPATPRVTDLADSLEACIALGRRLATGEITALRCGITGRYCRDCHGVPCLRASRGGGGVWPA